jgi:hypothetical protein
MLRYASSVEDSPMIAQLQAHTACSAFITALLAKTTDEASSGAHAGMSIQTNHNTIFVHVAPRPCHTSLPLLRKTCISTSMRQLPQQNNDASGSWRGPAQRKWDWTR